MVKPGVAFLPMLLFALASCSSDAQEGGRGARGGPTQVGFVTVQLTSAPLEVELDGRTAAFQTSEVRPQVNGLIRRRSFTEGSFVRQGAPLYQIDASLYQASVAEAQANVAAARATAQAAQVRANRLRPLAEIEAVSKQDYTDAAAQARQARAVVAQNQAQLRTSQINLRFTSIPAPISGRIGRSLSTVGALVTANQAEPLAVIQSVDPIYVDIQQSAAELTRLRQSLAAGGVTPGSTQVRLQLDDGTAYGFTGTVQFSELTVNEATGTVTVRARFPNPQGLLLPGMFVTTRFVQAVDQNIFLVPQAAVSRDVGGKAAVYIVGPGNKAQRKLIDATRTIGAFWVVKSGLRPGDKIITQGLANLKDGGAIRPVAATAPQRVVPPKPGEGPPGGGRGARGGG